MLEIVVAFGLDLVFGDPSYGWHPVRVIGQWIEKVEGWLRALGGEGKIAGTFLAFSIPLATFVLVWFLCEVAGQLHPTLKSLLTIFFLYSAIAVRDLQTEARKIYACLAHRKLEKARQNLSRIAGRATKDLSEEEVIRGTVESVAESFVDGVLSPLFYAALGGAPLAMTYKAINTLDSMVGYKTPRYREFGWMSAKLDEIVNWIPARISWLLIGIATFFVNGRGLEAWRIGLEDGAATSFPNSTVPEAAFAGALGVQLGGTNYYGEEKVETPPLGYPLRSLESDHIRVSNRLMKASAWVALVFALVLHSLVGFLWTKMVHPLSI